MKTPVVLALAALFALAHALHLPRSLEDIDSVNFALGVRDFDVADHRPHPPGYPFYIAAGKIVVPVAHALSSASSAQSAIEARALGSLSLLAGVASVLLLYGLFRALMPEASPGSSRFAGAEPMALAATVLAVACPLFSYMAVRPMSDLPGLAMVLAAQLCFARAWRIQAPTSARDQRMTSHALAGSGQLMVAGALLAGLAAGVRSQTVWLTVPPLLLLLGDRIGRGVAGALVGSAVAALAGALAWAVPLAIASGGVSAYLAALGSQAGEDFASGEMLYLNPAPRAAAFGLLRTAIYPWDSIALGAVVIALAALGVIALLLRARRTLAFVFASAAPYAVFHLLFQDTSFVRYALPLIPALTLLAMAGASLVARPAVLWTGAALAVWALMVAMPRLSAYSAAPSPTARAVEQMRATSLDGVGALALHQTFRRPLQAELLPAVPQLPSPPRREIGELLRYWREGGRETLWLLADPRRADLALIDPASRRDVTAYPWGIESLSSLGGVRPTSAWWYRLPPPGWFAGAGWALSPELAGMARLAAASPSVAPIEAFVRRRTEAATLVIGGRHLGPESSAPVTFSLTLDGQPFSSWDVRPGPFLRVERLAAGTLSGDGSLATLQIGAQTASGPLLETAIEQFDLQTDGTSMFAFGSGWHEAESSPSLGVWHWTADRADLHVINAARPVEVRMRIEAPRRYFDRGSTVTVSAGEHTLTSVSLLDEGELSVVVTPEQLGSSRGVLTLATDQTFVPAERDGTADRRRLGLRVFDLDVRPPMREVN